MSEEEILELSLTISKIVRFMKEQFGKGCVISFSNLPSSSELDDKLVINILPSNFKDIGKDAVTKLDSHLYVCTGSGITPRPDVLQVHPSSKNTTLWQDALSQASHVAISAESEALIPWQLQSTNTTRGYVTLIDQIFREGLKHHVFSPCDLSHALTLAHIPHENDAYDKYGCAFCLPDVINKQKAAESTHFLILYQQGPPSN